jgi:hypothetical protein
MSAKLAKKLLKKASKNAGKMGTKAAGKEEAKMRTRPAAGVIPAAVASENFDIMAGLDTSNVPGGNIESRLMALQEYGTPGIASAPRSEVLGEITMGLRDAQRALGGNPASLLFPDGLTTYLETVNRRTEDPSMKTRAYGLLDFF